MTTFFTQLKQQQQQLNSLVCIGLDPSPQKIPAHLTGSTTQRIMDFCWDIVRATAPFCSAFKPQIAYFSANAAEDVLVSLIHQIKQHYPQHLVILDAKRGDIGTTAEQYAIEAFERYCADAVTVNPYMGSDTIVPFSEYQDKGVIVLCRTSNAGGSECQFWGAQHQPLYLEIARRASRDWNHHHNIGLVVGGTYPEELAKVRCIAPDLPILIPGIGAQGGDLVATLNAATAHQPSPLIPYGKLWINSARQIIYASSGEDFAVQAAHQAQHLNQNIQTILAQQLKTQVMSS
jgi:orotidine-5'-phosphate decarboxylase